MHSPRTHFNSIKVQLKLAALGDYRDKIFGFQFHKGTIKTQASVPCAAMFAISIP